MTEQGQYALTLGHDKLLLRASTTIDGFLQFRLPNFPHMAWVNPWYGFSGTFQRCHALSSIPSSAHTHIQTHTQKEAIVFSYLEYMEVFQWNLSLPLLLESNPNLKQQ